MQNPPTIAHYDTLYRAVITHRRKQFKLISSRLFIQYLIQSYSDASDVQSARSRSWLNRTIDWRRNTQSAFLILLSLSLSYSLLLSHSLDSLDRDILGEILPPPPCSKVYNFEHLRNRVCVLWIFKYNIVCLLILKRVVVWMSC